MDASDKKPNHRLRQQRLQRSWTLEQVADELYKIAGRRERGDINAKMIGRWERGEYPPSLFWQEKLRFLYGKSAEELGLLETTPQETDTTSNEPLAAPNRFSVISALSTPQESPSLLTPHQALDYLCESACTLPEQRLGAWLALSSQDLAPLFDAGWTLDAVLESLYILLKGVQAMSLISRRKLLQLGAAAVVSGVPVPTGRHVSAEERACLNQALSESIIAAWKLFHTASNAQVLAIGQAQLYLVQQNHSLLSSRNRSIFYSSLYNLIGKALHFQGHYEQALEMHVNAHIAAMTAGDSLHPSQSLLCQSDAYQALGQYAEAIQAIEEALCLLGNSTEEEILRSKAHLLACWADNAKAMREHSIAQKKLEASAIYLDQIGSNEEFDRNSWLQLAGKHALMTGDYETALDYYETALRELPSHWLIRRVLVLIPTMVAYACRRDRDASLTTARQATSALATLNAPVMNRQLLVSAQRGLIDAFPNDVQVRTAFTDMQHQLAC
jgi:tetratricopeptide (TPR) repeat protein/transcriptional regulator with XRE-family HTH domain